MGYLTLDLECSECLRDLEFTQNKQVLTVKPCVCTANDPIRLESLSELRAKIEEQEKIIAAIKGKTNI